MYFKNFLPSPALRDYVQIYSLLQHEGNQDGATTEDLVAPGLGKGLISTLQTSDFAWVTNRNFRFRIAPGYFLPQCTQSYRMQLNRDVSMLAVIFRPGQFRRFFDLPASEIVDHQVVTFEEAGLRQLCELQERLVELVSIRQMLQLLEQYLIEQLGNRKFKNTLTDGFLHQIQHQMRPSIHELTQHFGVSERYLRRIFTDDIGINPKTYLRVRRFNLSFQLLKSGKYARLSDIAYDLGYADQSHFIREFKEFTETTPLQFFKEKRPLQNKLCWQDAL